MLHAMIINPYVQYVLAEYIQVEIGSLRQT
jgi:hypothetical protein